ncbi:protein of unknown function [Candidatus Nitrosocosmicus franklandus]|uniref:Uncharacterized protein n=1 Tax=Candidatus Nitrosocosmicus franklandianus TaxID=1798806 RepID=A0A484ID70_9ARCH|nr:protein of unknown function [Candidatus Nitrosocosmicus franklandus]
MLTFFIVIRLGEYKRSLIRTDITAGMDGIIVFKIPLIKGFRLFIPELLYFIRIDIG